MNNNDRESDLYYPRANSHEYSPREDPVPVLDNEELRKLIKEYKKDREYKLHPIGTWDVSNVTDMENLFVGFKEFNENLGGWDVSKVENMKGMFKGCTNFNRPLDNWVVSNVENMEGMFSGCKLFNQDLGRWNVSNVRNMSRMFYNCEDFDKPLDRWRNKVSNVENMEEMFYNCKLFNQNLGRWKVSNVKNMSYMFYNCENFNKPLNKWNVSDVRNMKGMFYNCINFNQSLNKWNVSNVTNMSYMFYNCTNFNQSLNWQISDHNGKINRNVKSMFDQSGMTELNKNETTGIKSLYHTILDQNPPIAIPRPSNNPKDLHRPAIPRLSDNLNDLHRPAISYKTYLDRIAMYAHDDLLKEKIGPNIYNRIMELTNHKPKSNSKSKSTGGKKHKSKFTRKIKHKKI